MNRYIIFLGFLIVSIGQVAWGNYFLIQGTVIPITVLYLWFILKKQDFTIVSLLAFTGGIAIDLLDASFLGTHAFILLITVGSMYFFEKRAFASNRTSRIISLMIGMVVYIVLNKYITQVLSPIIL